MKQRAKNAIQGFVIGLGILFMLGVFIKDFRIGLAELIAPILDPLFYVLPVHLLIFVLATFTAFYSSLIQKHTMDFAKFKEIQQKIFAFQKEYMEAVKQNNQFKIKQLEAQRQEIQRLQSEMMSMQFKSMFYTVVVTIPIFMWLWVKIYDVSFNTLDLSHLQSKLMINVPFAGQIHVSDPVLIIPWWIFWYLLCSVALSQIFKKVLRLGA